MMNQTEQQVLSEYQIFCDAKYLRDPLFTEKVNEFDRKMLKLRQVIQGLKNPDIIEEELLSIEQIVLSKSFIGNVSTMQFDVLLQRSIILFNATELTKLTAEKDSLLCLVNRSVKLALMQVFLNILAAKIEGIGEFTETVEKFLKTVIDFLHELLVSDQIVLDSCAFACFQSYERINTSSTSTNNNNNDEDDITEEDDQAGGGTGGSANGEGSSGEIRNTNFCHRMLRKVKKISKYLLEIHLHRSDSEFMLKYELLLLSCVKSSNYFSHYAGLLLLANVLKITEIPYHVAMHKLLVSVNVEKTEMIAVNRVFCVLSNAESLHTAIFAQLAGSEVAEQIAFFSFIHDGRFVDICLPYKFHDAKFNELSPKFSPTLSKSLALFYSQNVKPFVDDLPNQAKRMLSNVVGGGGGGGGAENLTDMLNLLAIFAKNPSLFGIDTLQLYDDLKATLDVLKNVMPDNAIYPHIVDLLLTLIIYFHSTKLTIQEVAGFLGYTSKSSALNKVVRGKIFFLIMYAPVIEQSEQIEELRQVQLKKKFSKLYKEIEGNPKLECFVMHCLELYFNNPDIKDLESSTDPDVLSKFLDYIQNKSQLVVEKSLCLAGSSNAGAAETATKSSRSFSTLVENFEQIGSVMHHINQIRSLMEIIPSSEKDFISSKLKQIAEEIQF